MVITSEKLKKSKSFQLFSILEFLEYVHYFLSKYYYKNKKIKETFGENENALRY